MKETHYKLKHRVTALFAAAVMLCSMLPGAAFAEEPTPQPTEETVQMEQQTEPSETDNGQTDESNPDPGEDVTEATPETAEEQPAEEEISAAVVGAELYTDLPNAPIGSYIGSEGLPVATGETKIGICEWPESQLEETSDSYLTAAVLDNDGLTMAAPLLDGADYAIVPIMAQVEYPANGSTLDLVLPDSVTLLDYYGAPAEDAESLLHNESTHLDRGHLHNHIVVNSVSYADGRMFRSDFNTYYKGIRKTSDELCRENRLSVIETDGKGKSYDEWLSGQAGKPTIRGMVRKDVEQAIAAADSFDGFILELQNMGYTVKYGPRVEHMAVRHKDAQRNIRIDRLDPRFSETALREYYRQLHRMPTEMQQEYRQENAPAKPKWQPTELQPTVRRARYLGKLPRRYPKVSGFMACYYHYCALLRKAYHGKATKRCYFLLREDFLLFSRYQQQTKFLWENHIETMDELLAYKENAEVQIQQLARQRKVLYRQKREPERAAREEKIKSLTQQMKALRHEVYICSDIETDAAEVQEKLRQAELAAQEERNEVKQDEQRRRSSRSDGAGSLTGYRSSH